MSELTQTQLNALVTAYGQAAARAARAPRNTSAARCAFEVENAACASLLAAIGLLVADREKLAAWKAAVEAQEPVAWAPTIVGNESVRGLGQSVLVWIDKPDVDHPGRGHCQTPLYAKPAGPEVQS